MKAALITPWPPQRSGIADYAYQLAGGLVARGVELSVFTAAPVPTPLPGCRIRHCTGQADTDIPVDALPVFQLGNNIAFHAFQPELLARLGGLVQLHDLVLHHFHVDRTLAMGRGTYWDDLCFWYGPAVVAAARRLVELGAPPWANAAAPAIPLFEPYLQYADAVLVHSTSAQATLAERLPGVRSYCLPQCYPLPAPSARTRAGADRPLRLGVFGWIEPHKRIDVILNAVAALRARGIALQLDICGPIGATMAGVREQIAALGLNSVARLRGHLDHDAFVSAIGRVDICINLRDPTMGETSAVVIQALQLGTPTIVSDAGWYAELPAWVLKVPVGEGAAEALVGHLSRLATDREQLAALADATRQFAMTELDFDVVTGRYAEIIAQLAAERARIRAVDRALYHDVACALTDLDLSAAGDEGLLRARILRTLAPCL